MKRQLEDGISLYSCCNRQLEDTKARGQMIAVSGLMKMRNVCDCGSKDSALAHVLIERRDIDRSADFEYGEDAAYVYHYL